MRTRVSRTDRGVARNILSDVASDKCFWVNNGPVLRNLRELRDLIDELPRETFRHHVNSDRNDFANWIRFVIGDEALAEKLDLIRTQRQTFRTIDRRVKELEMAV